MKRFINNIPCKYRPYIASFLGYIVGCELFAWYGMYRPLVNDDGVEYFITSSDAHLYTYLTFGIIIAVIYVVGNYVIGPIMDWTICCKPPKRTILCLLLLLLPLMTVAQEAVFTVEGDEDNDTFITSSMASRFLDEDDEWKEWSEWNDVDIYIRIKGTTKSFNKVIIYSKKHIEFDVLKVVEMDLTADNEADGVLLRMLLECLDDDDKRVDITMRYFDDDTWQLYVRYSDAQIVYTMEEI